MTLSRRAFVSLLAAVVLIIAGDVGALVGMDSRSLVAPESDVAQAGVPSAPVESTVTTTPQPVAPSTTARSRGQGAAQDKATQATTTSTMTTQPTPSQRPKLDPFDLAVSPACSTRGGILTVTLRTPPDTIVAVRVVDGAGAEIGSRSGQVGADGVFSVKFTVGPKAEPGTGLVLAVGSDLQGRSSGQSEAHFQIAEVAC